MRKESNDGHMVGCLSDHAQCESHVVKACSDHERMDRSRPRNEHISRWESGDGGVNGKKTELYGG